MPILTYHNIFYICGALFHSRVSVAVCIQLGDWLKESLLSHEDPMCSGRPVVADPDESIPESMGQSGGGDSPHDRRTGPAIWLLGTCSILPMTQHWLFILSRGMPGPRGTDNETTCDRRSPLRGEPLSTGLFKTVGRKSMNSDQRTHTYRLNC